MTQKAVLLAMIDDAAHRRMESIVTTGEFDQVVGEFDGGMSVACRRYLRAVPVAEDARREAAAARAAEREEREREERAVDFQALRREVWEEAKRKSELYMPLRTDLIPADLRLWAIQELRKSQAIMTRVFVYLTLREVMDFELAQTQPASEEELGNYAEATQLAEEKRSHRDAPRREVVPSEVEGEPDQYVTVTDSPARGLDLRGWDRPTPGRRVLTEVMELAAAEAEDDLRAAALKVKVTTQERPTDRTSKPKTTFSILYKNRKGVVFEFTHRGWHYNNARVATAVAQRLSWARASGALRRIEG